MMMMMMMMMMMIFSNTHPNRSQTKSSSASAFLTLKHGTTFYKFIPMLDQYCPISPILDKYEFLNFFLNATIYDDLNVSTYED